MKIQALKKLLKEAVKEAFDESFKDILLEAIKSQKPIQYTPIVEQQKTYIPPITETNPHLEESKKSLQPKSMAEKRALYENILNDTQVDMSPGAAGNFQSSPGKDIVNGDLGGGDVSMEQIMALTGK